MADLTTNEIGVALKPTLMSVDNSQNPPVVAPIDLTNATSVELLYTIQPPNSPQVAPTVRMMTVVNAVAGVVQYIFQSGDLAKPPNMGKNGVFRYSVKVTFVDGSALYTAEDVLLTIKDDSTV